MELIIGFIALVIGVIMASVGCYVILAGMDEEINKDER